MFDKSTCVLCLETIGESTGQIDIDSAEGQALDVQQTLEQHFKHELSATLSCATVRILCGKCWDSVFTFHEFYLRVQRAHTKATETLRMAAALTIEQGIKLEADLDATEDAAPLTKRNRRRLHEKVVPDTNSKIIVAPECNVQSGEADLCPTEPKLQFEQIDLPSTEANTQLDTDNIKHEILQEELMPTDCASSERNCESASDGSTSADCLGVSASKVQVMKRKKGAERRSILSTKESDDFIAQNFELNCCLCNSPQETFSELTTHFRIQHQTRGYVRCCGKKILQRALLVDHLRTHQNPEYFKCPKCGKVLVSRSCFEFHLKNHEDVRDRNYQCDVCSKRFYRPANLKRHALTHVPEEERLYACSQCDKTYASDYTMTKHMKEVHLNSFGKICDICGKCIQGREALRLHMEEHTGVKHPPVECQLCGTLVKSKYGLNRHMKTMHTEKYRTPQTCPVCAKVSPSLRAHQHHMKYMHTIIPKHSCPTCGKSFKQLTNYREHMATHTGEVLYTCTYCPKTFNSNANMYVHRKKMHPKEWAENHMSKAKNIAQENTKLIKL